jgi:hypothetical protein
LAAVTEVVPLVTVPDGLPAATEPETLLGCVLIETGMVVFCRDQSTVFEFTVLPELSVTVQYMVPLLVLLASTEPVTPVVADVPAVNDAPEPLAMYH